MVQAVKGCYPQQSMLRGPESSPAGPGTAPRTGTAAHRAGFGAGLRGFLIAAVMAHVAGHAAAMPQGSGKDAPAARPSKLGSLDSPSKSNKTDQGTKGSGTEGADPGAIQKDGAGQGDAGQQTQAAAPKPTPLPTASDGLAPDPVVLDALGVSIRPPGGALVQRIPGSNQYVINDSQDPPRYLIRVQSMISSTPSSTPAEQFDDHLRFLHERGAQYRVLVERDDPVGGQPAKIAYVAMPMEGGLTAITGWCMVQTAPNMFVVFSLLSSGVDFGAVEPLLDRSFETVSLQTLEAISAARAERLERGAAAIATFTPARLKQLTDGRQRWFRVYKPGGAADGSDRELGWIVMKVFEADRDEVKPGTPPRPREQAEMGLMVALDAKMLIDGDATHTVDVQTRIWMAWDRSSETWTIVSTERQAKMVRSWEQTGWRTAPSPGEPRSVLHVINSTRSTRDPFQWQIPSGAYLNQAEVILLGRLLPRDGSVDGELSFYCYDGKLNRMPQRQDRWTREPDGRCTLVTRPFQEGPEYTQLFSPSGERLRRIDPDGVVTEATELEDLRRLWKSKGLPTG